MKKRTLGVSSFVASLGLLGAAVLHPMPGKAVLYINFVPLTPTTTRVTASGSIDRSLLPTGADADPGPISFAPSGSNTSRISPSADVLGFTYAASSGSEPGVRFKMSGLTNPFTGTDGTILQSGATPSNAPPFVLRFNNQAVSPPFSQIFLLPDSYITNTPISGFFDINKSLADLGVLNSTYTVGGEQIMIVPGPLPLFGAAAAFGFSRRLRKRVRQSKQVALASGISS